MLYTGANRERLGNSVYGAFGRDFITSDGTRLMLMAITSRQWTGLVKVLGIATDIAAIEAERGVSFDHDEGVRFQHRNVLFPLVEAKVAGWNYSELKVALDAVGGCYGPYQTMYDAAHDPVLVGDNPMFGRTDHPSGFDYPAAGSIANIPQIERGVPLPAPLLGAHSEEILADRLGLTTALIGDLHTRGIIGLHKKETNA